MRASPRCSRCGARPPPGQRLCFACHAEYMRAWRATGAEADQVWERYQTDPKYREHRKALARESMRLTRLRRRLGLA